MNFYLTISRQAYCAAHSVATNPFLTMISGLFVVSLGGLDLWMTKQRVFDTLFSVESGLIITGLQQLAFGLTNLLLGVRLAGIGLLGAEHKEHHDVFNWMLRGFVDNPFLNFGLGLMLLLMVLGQAWEEWFFSVSSEPRSVWYFGIGLMALLTVARSLESGLLALGIMGNAERKGHFHHRLVAAINRHVRKPWLLVSVASVCLLLGVAEEVFIVATNPQTGHFIAHYGFLLFVVLEVVKLIPVLFFGSLLADEGLHSPPDSPGKSRK